MRTDKIAISQTIQNHKNAIYDLAAIVEGLEVRWNDVRGYYSYVPFSSIHPYILPSTLAFRFRPSYSLPPLFPLPSPLSLLSTPRLAPLVLAPLLRFARDSLGR